MKLDKGLVRLTLVLSLSVGLMALLIYERRTHESFFDSEGDEVLRRVWTAYREGEQALRRLVSEYYGQSPKIIDESRAKELSDGATVGDIAASILYGIYDERRSREALVHRILWLAQRKSSGVGGDYVLAFLIGFAGTWALYAFIRYGVYLCVRWIVRGFEGGKTMRKRDNAHEC